jgi:hypothetical protein
MVAVRPGPDGGAVVVLRPDGTWARPPVYGNGIVVPWAIAIDGNDHIWVSNFSNPPDSIAEPCGYRTETCPPGTPHVRRACIRSNKAQRKLTAAVYCRGGARDPGPT